MRHVKKEFSGEGQLGRHHAAPPRTAEEAKHGWDNFPNGKPLLELLLEEQFFLCCYSELRSDILKLGYHIEHIQPKSQFPHRTFDYQNLAACALDSKNDLKAFKSQGSAFFGGHHKQNKYDATLFISCHEADCARFFNYVSDGRIIAAPGLTADEQARAKYTITVLNLDCPFLRLQRRRWWDELDQLLQQHLDDDWDVAHLAAIDLVPSDKKLSPFFSLTGQFFGRISKQVLEKYATYLL